MKILFFAALLLSSVEGQSFNDAKFNALVSKLEMDAVALAREVERLYANRCDQLTLDQCNQGNYDDCLTLYPQQTCPGGDELNIDICGDGVSCSGLWDFTVSGVSIPADLADGPDRNPTDPQVIEAVCFTRDLDKFLTDKKAEDQAYWDNIGVEAPSFHFGSHTGVFRIFPARQSQDCGVYDPRLRPWYVAASSGPKNVVMVLDTSGSMKGLRLALMKEAAKRVVNTLAIGDRVAIVAFDSNATVITDGAFLFEATDENKAFLVQRIEQLEAKGATNFQDAFTKTFDLLDRSIANEFNVNCNTAILFLTDGVMTQPAGITNQDVIDLVDDRIRETSFGKPILLFTYSVSEDGKVDDFPSQLACSTELGVWSKVANDDEIVESLSSYYFLFALGLGEKENEGFTAWVEPYVYSTGGILGTTVSAPVYDRSKDPPLFLGVAGVDFLVAALDSALGVENGNAESLERVALASKASCPNLNLTLCELESFRRRGSAGDDALCSSGCTASDFVQLEEEMCSAVSDHPRDLWTNTDNRGKSFTNRICCEVGETTSSDTCGNEDSSSSLNIGAIVGGAIGGLLVIGIIALVSVKISRKRSFGKSEQAIATMPPAIQPPPHNPHYNPSAPPGSS